MKILLIFLILTVPSFALAQTESKCFQSDWLQGKRLVNFKTKGKQVSGTFSVENYDGESAKTYEFSGTRAGDALKVKFDNGKLPDVAPSEMKNTNWRLSKTADKEILRIEFYGKNHETNRHTDYFTDFESCEPTYTALLKTANTVQFAKGKTSTIAPLSFRHIAERKVFSINIRRGQTLEIDAASCKVSVYLPDEKHYEFVEWENGGEKTVASSTIDRMIIKPIPQTGRYLVALQKMAEDARPASVTFKITN